MPAFEKSLAVAIVLVGSSACLEDAIAQPATTGGAVKSAVILCNLSDARNLAIKDDAERAKVMASNAKYIAFSLAMDRQFPHLSAFIDDRSNFLRGFSLSYVGGQPPRMEIVGKNSIGEDVIVGVGVRSEAQGGSSAVVTVSKDGGAATELYSGPCLVEPRQEHFDGLKTVLDDYYGRWLEKRKS